MRSGTLLLSCEHGGNRVPRKYASLFASRRARHALASHRGYDIGALAVARALASRCGVDLLAVTVTRLLVELNRSVGHPGLFSEFSRTLSPQERAHILARYYRPHRERVHAAVAAARAGPVCHVSVHSFTSVLDGRRRRADIGLLYNPGRAHERALAARWRAILAELDPTLRVRRNYPYRGTADGLTTTLRQVFAAERYLGFELEINQALLGSARRKPTTATLAASLVALLDAG